MWEVVKRIVGCDLHSCLFRKEMYVGDRVLADIKRKEKDNQPGLTDGYK